MPVEFEMNAVGSPDGVRLAGSLVGMNGAVTVSPETARAISNLLTQAATQFELTIDAKAERFTGESARWANMYVGRIYRPPFVLPDEV